MLGVGIILAAAAASFFAWQFVSERASSRPVRSTSGVLVWSAPPSPPALSRSQPLVLARPLPVRELVVYQGLVWGATDGGLAVWDPASGDTTHWTSAHGLPANRLTALAFDQSGQLWVGSQQGGISRFDGVTWQRFDAAAGNLPSDQVHDVTVSRDGHVWVATAAGLAVTENGGATWETVGSLNPLSLLNGRPVTALAAAVDGIWAGTNAGVLFIDREGQVTPMSQRDGLAADQVADLQFTPDGRLWIATANGLNIVETGSGKIHWIGRRDGLLSNQISRLFAHGDGRIWAAYPPDTGALSLIEWSAVAPQISHLAGESGRLPEPLTAVAPAATADRFWVATTKGVALGSLDATVGWDHLSPLDQVNGGAVQALAVDGETVLAGDGTHIWQINDDGRAIAAPLPHAAALFVGQDGTAWAAGPVAAAGFSYRKETGSAWSAIGCPQSGPIGNRITAAAQGADGRLWVASAGGLSSLEQGVWRYWDQSSGLPTGPVTDVIIDGQERIWAATPAGVWLLSIHDRWEFVAALSLIDLEAAPSGEIVFGRSADGQLWIHSSFPNGFTPLPAPAVGEISSMVVERGGSQTGEVGRLWVSGVDGVARYQHGKWTRFSAADGLPTNRVNQLVVDQTGAVSAIVAIHHGAVDDRFPGYTVTHEFVARFREEKWWIENITNPAGPAHGRVTSLIVTPSGDVWVATLAGVSHFVAADRRWRHFMGLDGLPHAPIVGLTTAGERIVAVTRQGLFMFDPSAGKWIPFKAPEGLTFESDRLFLPRSESGRLWLVETNTRGSFQAVWDAGRWRVTEIPVPGGETIGAVALDRAGELWVATREAAAAVTGGSIFRILRPDGTVVVVPVPFEEMVFDEFGRLWLKNGEVTWRITDPSAGVPSEPRRVRPLRDPFAASQTDRAGSVWAIAASGVSRTGPSGRFTFSGPGGQTPRTVTAAQIDEEGVLWLGDSGGQIRYFSAAGDGLLPPITNRPFPITTLTRPPGNFIWAGSAGGGVASHPTLREQPSDQPAQSHAVGWRLVPSTAEEMIAPVVSLAVTDDQELWLGTLAGAFSKDLNELTASCVYYPATADLAVTAIIPDKDDHVWLVAAGSVWHAGNGQVAPADAWRRDGRIFVDGTRAPNGEVWLLTRENVVFLRSGRWEEIPWELPTQAPLTTLAVDQRGHLWLGTGGDGVWIWNLNDGWTQRGLADGLPDLFVRDIGLTADEAVWVATAGGIVRLPTVARQEPTK